MSKYWDTSSIDTMEKTARSQADGSCNICIRGKWLEVIAHEDGTFSYKWGKNSVSRKHATEVHSTRD